MPRRMAGPADRALAAPAFELLAITRRRPGDRSVSGLWEVLALRYARLPQRTRRESLLGVDAHDAAPMPLDYYVWVLRAGDRVILVDTGFDAEEGARRGRVIEREPRAGLALLGIDPAAIADVIVTHLHYDHAGTLDHFPAARFHLQETEMAYATGRCMSYATLRQPYSVEHVCTMVRRVFDGRVAFHDGDGEIAPGVTVHRIGGHAKGIQCVRVATARGPVVLASDCAHYYENLLDHRPFIIVHDVEATLRGYDRLRALAPSTDHIVPGHDPLVMARYPAPGARLEGIVARLDLPPRPA
jgi:glyoxylase-like metal-dependent hydrolase (beta-lactamase superfamily II)